MLRVPASVTHADADARTDGGAVRAPAFEFQLDPAVAVSGVPEEDVLVYVPREGATDHREDILVSVVIDVPEGDAMPLLQVSEAAGGGDVLKVSAPAALRNIRLGTMVAKYGSPVPM